MACVINSVRNSVYVLVAACSVAMAACQPFGTTAEREDAMPVDMDIAQAAKRLDLSYPTDPATDQAESSAHGATK